MEITARRPSWRMLLVPILALTLMFGWVAFASSRGDAPPAPNLPKLELGDLLLAAAKAKGPIMAFDGITGPAGTNHADHARVISFSWGASRPMTHTGGGGATGKLSVAEVNLTRLVDKYSGKLMDNLATARRAATVNIYFTNAAAKGVPLDYLEFELEDVVISSYQLSGATEIPTESLSLFFDKLTVKSRLSGAEESIEFDLRSPA